MPSLRISVAIFSSILILFFQNCSDVDFETTDELRRAGIDGELRSISISPETQTERPKLNLTAIIDNSNSMTPVQNEVANALSQVSDRIKGFEGQVEIYTTNQTSGDKVSHKKVSYIEYFDGPNRIQVPLSQESQIPAPIPYTIVTDYQISNSFTPFDQPIPYNSQMSDTEFNQFSDQFSDSIGVIGVEGSDQEQGLCTLVRSIQAKSDETSFEAFIIAANEDDATELLKCLDDERKDVHKELQNPELVECDPGEPGCQYQYQVNYQRKHKEVLKYKYREVSEQLSYELNTPDVTRRLKYKYKRYRQYYKYKENIYRQWVTYKRYSLIDNLPVEESNTRQYVQINNQLGFCPQGEKSNVAISCDLAGIPANQIPYGVVPGSCFLSCDNKLSGEKSQQLHGYKGGYCADDGITAGRRNCQGGDLADLSGRINRNQNLIGQCQIDCQNNESGWKYENLSSNPGNCGQTCNNNQRQLAADDSPNYIGSNDITSCSVQCTESFPSGDLSYDSGISACEGVGSSSSGSQSGQTCSSAMLQEVADRKNVPTGEIKSCSYSCSQTIRNGSKTISNDSQCSLGENSCTTQESSVVANHLFDREGLSGDYIVGGSCKNSCENGSSKNPCHVTLAQSNLCQNGDPAPALENACADSSFSISSCAYKGGIKPSEEAEYEKVEQSLSKRSLFNENSTIAEQVSQKLDERFKNRFYLASFVVPPNDPNCLPESQWIEPAERYSELHSLIGPKRGRLFPLCLSDYSPALSFVLDLVVKKVNSSYVIDIDTENEFIWKIRITRKDGSVVELDKKFYDLNQNVLTFSEDVILSEIEKIEVEIVTENKN